MSKELRCYTLCKDMVEGNTFKNLPVTEGVNTVRKYRKKCIEQKNECEKYKKEITELKKENKMLKEKLSKY